MQLDLCLNESKHDVGDGDATDATVKTLGRLIGMMEHEEVLHGRVHARVRVSQHHCRTPSVVSNVRC